MTIQRKVTPRYGGTRSRTSIVLNSRVRSRRASRDRSQVKRLPGKPIRGRDRNHCRRAERTGATGAGNRAVGEARAQDVVLALPPVAARYFESARRRLPRLCPSGSEEVVASAR